MRLRLALLCLLAFPVVAHADAYYLPIAGSVGTFRTDVRIYNPATTDSHLSLVFIPTGNQNNGAAFLQPVQVTLPAGKEVAYDDAVASIFAMTGLGAITIEADTALLITTRIYAQTDVGTLGQGYRAERLANLITDGVLIQLRADASFRSNIGIANLQNSLAHVTFTLYDKNNNQVSQGTITLEPYAVIAPTSITANFFFAAPNADLSDARVTFHSDSPIGAYGSVIDNATSDPTYFPAMSTSGF